MANLIVRGLDVQVLTALKQRAADEAGGVNALVLRLIDQGLGRQRSKPQRRRHADLDALAGTWRGAEAEAFERATAPFQRVDAKLWK